MKIDEQWELMLIYDRCGKNEGMYTGEKDDTCDQGSSRRSLRVKPPKGLTVSGLQSRGGVNYSEFEWFVPTTSY